MRFQRTYKFITQKRTFFFCRVILSSGKSIMSLCKTYIWCRFEHSEKAYSSVNPEQCRHQGRLYKTRVYSECSQHQNTRFWLTNSVTDYTKSQLPFYSIGPSEKRVRCCPEICKLISEFINPTELTKEIADIKIRNIAAQDRKSLSLRVLLTTQPTSWLSQNKLDSTVKPISNWKSCKSCINKPEKWTASPTLWSIVITEATVVLFIFPGVTLSMLHNCSQAESH